MEPKDMGNKIKNARMAKGMTQKELASQVHVTDKAVSKWERGLCFPDMSNLEPLADALGMKMTELFTYTFSHTDEEVVDYTAELVNDLLDGKGYEFDFLMENLWWPGLTLTRPEITRRLLDQIHYPKKGIMLDTGHLMHTNLELAAQEEAVDYILDMVRAHSDMIPYMKGIHLNQSLTGQYVKDLLKKRDEMPKTHKERVNACYEHVFQIDGHFPFTTPRVREIIEAVAPDYLTYELITSDREEHEEKLLRQCEALGVMVDGV